ncbi:Protein PTHB1 [Collichthys lucidus]|nr:Protein PTHB1 [Collichthys lucidus]
MWLVVKELVQRFDRHFTKLGVKDFKKSFSGPLPLQEYFLSVDHHFQGNVSVLVRGPQVVDRWDEPSVCQQTQTDEDLLK